MSAPAEEHSATDEAASKDKAEEDNKASPEEENDSEEEEAQSDSHPDYGNPAYWDKRYSEWVEPFDWYLSWSTLFGTLKPLFTGDETVLNIGCGNSRMSADMVSTTFKGVTSIDISSVVIEQMRHNYAGNPALKWETMDCTDLKFDNEMFDLAFDKGTLDAIFCGSFSEETIQLTLYEVYRVLKPAGLFIEITYGRPEARLQIFNKPKLDWVVHDPIMIERPDGDGSFHYVYIFQKGVPGTEEDEGTDNTEAKESQTGSAAPAEKDGNAKKENHTGSVQQTENDGNNKEEAEVNNTTSPSPAGNDSAAREKKQK